MDSRIRSAGLVHTHGRGFSFQFLIHADICVEHADGRVSTAAQQLGAQLTEPPFDEVDPAAGGRGEVQHEPGVLREPVDDLRDLAR